jgi:hypothetical protein
MFLESFPAILITLYSAYEVEFSHLKVKRTVIMLKSLKFMQFI